MKYFPMTKTSINEARSVSLCDTFRRLSSRDEDPQSVHDSEKPLRLQIQFSSFPALSYFFPMKIYHNGRHSLINHQYNTGRYVGNFFFGNDRLSNCDHIQTLKIPQAGLCAPAVKFCAGGVACRAFFTSFTFVDVASPEQCRFLNEIHFRNK